MIRYFSGLLSLLFLILFSSLKSQPEWERVALATGHYSYIRCINDVNCVGIATHSEGNAKLIKTTDAGKTWFDLYVENYVFRGDGTRIFPDPREMCSISYVDENHIFIGRNRGCIFVSRDGGKSFDTVVIAEKIDDKFVSASRIFNLYMTDSLNGAALSSPYICITNDGWKTFKKIKLNDSLIPEGFRFTIGGSLTTTFKYWNSKSFMMDFTISIKHSETSYERLNYGIISTTDGGETWNMIDFMPIIQHNYITIADIFFLGDIGWIVGNIVLKSGYSYDHAYVFKSYDKGKTWNYIHRDSTAPMTGFFSISFTDELNGTVVGRYGKILRTTDGGYTWFRDSFLNLSNNERNWRIVQKVTYAGEHVLLSTFGDGLWRGTYTPSDIIHEPSGMNTSIFPNPTRDYIYINFNDLDEVHSPSYKRGSGGVRIYNTLGQCVSHLTPTLSKGEGVRIDVSQLPVGVYLVRVGNRVEKFVKV